MFVIVYFGTNMVISALVSNHVLTNMWDEITYLSIPESHRLQRFITTGWIQHFRKQAGIKNNRASIFGRWYHFTSDVQWNILYAITSTQCVELCKNAFKVNNKRFGVLLSPRVFVDNWRAFPNQSYFQSQNHPVHYTVDSMNFIHIIIAASSGSKAALVKFKKLTTCTFRTLNSWGQGRTYVTGIYQQWFR